MTVTETGRPNCHSGAPTNQISESILTANQALTDDQRRALQIAHSLVDAGIPVFVAAKNHGNGPEFHYPKGWENARPSHAAVDRWRPGWALCAVGGHAADFLDTDPRNGGDTSRASAIRAGQWPQVFGVASTPSGGTHEIISRTHEAKGEPWTGVDLQAGDDAGEGRGFVYIAPTVRVAKAGPRQGQEVTYRWEVEPDLGLLAEFDHDPSVEGVRSALVAKRNRRTLAPAPAVAVSDDRLFEPAGSGPWTPDVADRQITMQLDRVRGAQVGQVNGTLGGAARVLGRFVAGGYLGRAEALDSLLKATDANPVHSDRWNLDNGTGWVAQDVIENGLTRGSTEPWTVQAPPTAVKQTDRLERMRARIFSRDRLDAIQPPTALIDGVLDVGTVAFLSGKFGTYKTFVSLSWASSIATGQPWEGREVVTPGPVLYVAAEGASGLRSRIEAWESGLNSGRRIQSGQLQVFNGRVKLTDPEEMAAFRDIVQEIEPVLIVLDTLHKCAPGMEENSSKDMGTVMDAVADLRDLGPTILLNHHTGHSGERSRGSSSLEDDADTSFVVKLADSEDRSAGNQRTLVHRKAKDRELTTDLDMVLELVDGTGSGFIRSGSVVRPGQLDRGAYAEIVIKALDDAGVPVSAGRDTCRKALGPSFKVATEVLADAIRQRKDRAK